MTTTTDLSTLGKFEVTAQLFRLIDGMSKEKQFILLKQLLGTDLPVHLMRMILDMTENQRADLLKALGEAPAEETPVKTVLLDETSNLMRGNMRQQCRIPVRIKTAEDTHDCTITDIGTFGVFIKSHTRHAAGKKIQLAFSLPGSKEPMMIQGKIVRSTPSGIGVRFQKLKARHFEEIKRYCEVN